MTQPCRPGQYINRESCISTAIKSKANKRLVGTAVSTWAVYQPRSAKQKHLWYSCISPARYSCISTAKQKKNKAKALLNDTAVSTWAVYQPREQYVNGNQNQSESTSGRHNPVDLGGVSTAISEAKASLAQLYITSALYKPRSKRKHISRSGDDQGGLSTAISKETAYPARLYITNTVYHLRSANGKLIWRSCTSTTISTANSSRAPPRRHM